MSVISDYKKYRWFFTSSGNLVIGGKSALQNDELLSALKKTKNDFIVMHTSLPGSPFSVILSEKRFLVEKDLEETAIFTACFSKAWKLQKKSESVDIFSLSQLSKSQKMKAGSWKVSGKIKRKLVLLSLVLITQENILRAVPTPSAKKSEYLLSVYPGKSDKTLVVEKIQKALKLNFSREDILSALPPGGVRIKNEKHT